MSEESLTKSYPFPGEQPETNPGGQSHEEVKMRPIDDTARRLPHEWHGGTGQLFGDKTLPQEEHLPEE